ncbi:hypothetical protein GN956_G19058 [Arapaima gigas]
MSHSATLRLLLGLGLLSLIDGPDLREITEKDKNGPLYCAVCNQEECPEKLNKIYQAGQDTPLWERTPEGIQSCSDSELKLDVPCQHDNAVYLPVKSNTEKFQFEGSGKELKSEIMKCPHLPQQGENKESIGGPTGKHTGTGVAGTIIIVFGAQYCMTLAG